MLSTFDAIGLTGCVVLGTPSGSSREVLRRLPPLTS